MPQPRTIQGVSVSFGLALGAVHVVRARRESVPAWTVPEAELEAETARLAAALAQAEGELAERQKAVARDSSAKDAEIFAVHRMILQDPGALKEVEATIRAERVNAETAVQKLIDRFEDTLGRMEADGAKSYAPDFSDPWLRVLDALLRREREAIESSDEKVILAAEELTPQVVTYLERARVLAVVAERGGRFSHGAVLARSFGVPCVIGLSNLMARLEQGMVVAVDGDRATVQLKPEEADLTEFRDRQARLLARREELARDAARPAETPDGGRLGVWVNIESVRDLDFFDPEHTDGVGLLRTEFLYMERNQFPSEEEQYRLYRRVLEHMSPRSVVIRTLDIGGDKPLPYFQTPKETNPVLGWRGLRITLEWQDLMRVQLRALLRASTHGHMRVLLPMVTSMEEVRLVHDLFDQVRSDLLSQGYEVADDVPVGVMVEVPSTLLAIRQIVDEVDFVSVGTNDLVQYLLAVDRDNPWVAALYEPYHPAVMKALERVAEAAIQAGKPAAVCGEIAGDPAMALLLLGLGYDSVSVSPHFVPDIKYAVRRTPLKRAASLAREALSRTTVVGVREVLESALKGL